MRVLQNRWHEWKKVCLLILSNIYITHCSVTDSRVKKYKKTFHGLITKPKGSSFACNVNISDLWILVKIYYDKFWLEHSGIYLSFTASIDLSEVIRVFCFPKWHWRGGFSYLRLSHTFYVMLKVLFEKVKTVHFYKHRLVWNNYYWVWRPALQKAASSLLMFPVLEVPNLRCSIFWSSIVNHSWDHFVHK